MGIPVLANGNILSLADANECMAYTGADGVLSADPLLANPALFSDRPVRHQNRFHIGSASDEADDLAFYLQSAACTQVAVQMSGIASAYWHTHMPSSAHNRYMLPFLPCRQDAEQVWAERPGLRGCVLLQQYLDLVDQYPTPGRMQRAHMHKLLGDWLQVCHLMVVFGKTTIVDLVLLQPDVCIVQCVC